jgi:hypothetical protein
MRSTETLPARKHSHHERQERIITEALAERWPDPERQQALRLVGMAGLGTLPLAIEIWSRLERRGPLAGHLDEGLLQVLKELRGDDHARRVVMRACNGRLHADQAEIDVVAGRRLGDHRFHEALEDLVTRPHPEPVVDRRPGAVALRHMPPGAAGSEPPHHRVEG